MRRSRLIHIASPAAVFALYYAAARLGLQMDAVSGFATLVWAPTGIALAATFIFGYRILPAVTAAAFLVNVGSGAPILVATGIALGNTAEAFLGALLLRRRGFHPSFGRVQDVVSFLVFAALLSTAVSAAVGTTSLWLGGVIGLDTIRPTLKAWWVGDVVGNLIIAPLIFVWFARGMVVKNLSATRNLETAALVGVVAGFVLAVFDQRAAPVLLAVHLPYAVFPIVIWTALRFGIRATVTTSFVLAVAAVAATTLGRGPFARESLSEGLALLHLFTGAIAVMALTLATAVTERVQAAIQANSHAGRHEADERFRAVLQSAHDGFVAMDAEGFITYWNPRAEAMLGWTSEEVLGKPIAETIIPPRLRHDHYRGVRHFLATGEGPIFNKRLELPALHKAGHEVPVELTVSPSKAGDSYLFGAFLHDISARKRTELLQATQLGVTRVLVGSPTVGEAARKVLETIGAGLGWEFGALWTLDEGSGLLRLEDSWCASGVQRGFEEITRGKTFAPGVGLPGRILETRAPAWIADVTKDTNFPRALHAVRAGLHGAFGFPLMVNSRVVGVMEFFSSSKQQPDERLLEAMTDIGERFGLFIQRHWAERELRRLHEELEQRVADRTSELQSAESELRFITDALPAGVIYVDLEQRFRFVNATFARWRSRAKEEVVGRSLAEVLGSDAQAVVIGIESALSGRSETYEVDVRFLNGSRRVSVTGIPVLDAAGVSKGMIGIIVDVSDQKAAADALLRAKEIAEAANRAKTEFLSNMSHEIRTPLGAVLGFSELLTGPRLSQGDRQEYVAAIRRNGDLLSNIINDILDLSKVEAGKLEIERRLVPLVEVLTDVTAVLKLQAQEKGLLLSVTYDGCVPTRIETDALRLRQILFNIVGNAIKFTRRGTIEVIVTLLAGEGRRKLAFTVRDSGTGISDQQAAKLFEPFSQADASTKRKFGGTGLGLVLSKRLATALGGDVVLSESSPGQGSTFIVTIDPGEIEESTQGSVEVKVNPEPSPLQAEPKPLVGMKILLVEDAPDNQLLVGRYLKMAGAKVDIAQNGKEALERVHGQTYDVLLMDLQMPVMDGFEATAELRSRGYGRPIIALTAHALKEEHEKCLASGFSDHVGKPIDRKLLIERIAFHGGRRDDGQFVAH